MPEPDAAPPPPKRKSRLPMMLGLALGLLLGAGGFYASYARLILPGGSLPWAHTAVPSGAGPPVAFVAVDPVMISLGAAGLNQHLRMSAQLEVPPAYVAEVTHLIPRVLDVTNTYLRAVEVTRLQDPAALIRIRGHLLRRIQLVTGEGRVNDLLITEFILN
ncbi:flagellar basal body-associated FliL family protein [Gemmobacter serpentinus]|uniref:flagellar basal body-associated FliL family protein n=1 Tax=Gemmobacter serpentinus TaxID=2652247 RepID=UPI00124E835A|nr:flagellar basal body-associated FliL family protein [Gemmobacter serpentinus]